MVWPLQPSGPTVGSVMTLATSLYPPTSLPPLFFSLSLPELEVPPLHVPEVLLVLGVPGPQHVLGPAFSHGVTFVLVILEIERKSVNQRLEWLCKGHMTYTLNLLVFFQEFQWPILLHKELRRAMEEEVSTLFSSKFSNEYRILAGVDIICLASGKSSNFQAMLSSLPMIIIQFTSFHFSLGIRPKHQWV